MADDYTRQQDPNEQYPQTKSPEQEQEHAGPHFEMQSEPDYGYKPYRGNGHLDGKASIITGEDSGIGRLSSPSPARGRTSCPPTPYKVPFDTQLGDDLCSVVPCEVCAEAKATATVPTVQLLVRFFSCPTVFLSLQTRPRHN